MPCILLNELEYVKSGVSNGASLEVLKKRFVARILFLLYFRS
jgi:hypothetical protein